LASRRDPWQNEDDHPPRALSEFPGMSLSALFAAPPQIRVERAVAELRAARPVLLGDNGDARLIQAVDGLDADRLAALTALGEPAVVLSAERVRWLGGAATAEATPYALTANDTLDSLTTLAFAEKAALDSRSLAGDAFDLAPALELTHLARLAPAVISVRLDDARRAALTELAATVSTADVALYATDAARAMTIVADAPVPLRPDIASRFVVFRGGETIHDQVAIVVGRPDPTKPVHVRLHSACLTGDLFGSLKCDCGDQLSMAVERFAELGGGIVLYLDQEGRGIGIANKMRAYELQAEGYDTIDADARLGFHLDERRWHDAARMLDLLGISAVRLHSNNPRKAEALEAAGIRVAARESVLARVTPENARYLRTKAARAGHLIDNQWLDAAEAALKTGQP
jgi:GTP cyclohydrolase II